jgi:small-conductance mechanosensitive channel
MIVTEIGKERKTLARSMRDVNSAIEKLDDVLVVVVFIIAIFVFISFLNSNFTTTLATAGAALLSLSFMFSATCQEVLASIIFLFHKHPFDVGDRVNINGSKYVVKELSLLFTIFKRLDGTIVQANNATLNSLFIENIRRAVTVSETVQLSVDFGTSFSAIQKLRKEMQDFVRANARDYASELEIEIVDATGLNKLLLQLVIRHKSNWQNDALRAHRRNKVHAIAAALMQFMCALVKAIRKVGISASGPGLGDAKNPMHVVKTIAGKATKKRPSSSSSESDAHASLGRKKSIAADPATHLDDDHLLSRDLQYYTTAQHAESQLSPSSSGHESESDKILGRRRKQVGTDLEKGSS